MKKGRLSGKRIAILATDGFEESELSKPMDAIKKEGGTAEIVSLEKDDIKSWKDGDWGGKFHVDKLVSDVSSSDYDALVLPGGVINPDQLRRNKEAVSFVKSFFNEKSQKPVAAICHGPWMLIEADAVRDRKMTSFNSIKTDMENAGAIWEDSEVVVDQGLVTSRSPEDLGAFCSKFVEEICEGQHRI